MNKKGLSDIVTTVLIILIVFAAVFIIWIAIKQGVIDRVSDVDAQCLNLRLSVVSCTNVKDASSVYANTTVQVKRDAGEATVDHLIFLFQYSTGTVKRVDWVSGLNELETGTAYGAANTSVRTDAPVSVGVTAAVKNTNNQVKPCPDTQTKVTCS